jgi:hypothetical protein
MRYFLIDDGEGRSLVKVSKGKELADLGYSEEVIAAAEERPRPPHAHESWDEEAGAWVLDEEAKARADEDARLAAMSLCERHELAVRTAMEGVAAVGAVTALVGFLAPAEPAAPLDTEGAQE